MAFRFVLDPQGNEALLNALASGLNEWAMEAAKSIRAAAPRGQRGTPRPLPLKGGGRYVFKGEPRLGGPRYRATIHATTYLNGKQFAGPNIRGIGERSSRSVRSVIYSTAFTAHMLEFGTSPHEIPVATTSKHGPLAAKPRIALHPGSGRKPHFWPGLASALPRLGPIMASRGLAVGKIGGRVNTRVL